MGLVGEGVQFALSSLDFHGTNFTYGQGFDFDHITSIGTNDVKKHRDLKRRLQDEQ